MDRADIYAAMAEMEDDAADAAALDKPLVRPQTLNLQGGASVDVNGVDVATLAYVKRLEKIIVQQTVEMSKQARSIRALEQSLRQVRTIANNHSGRFADISRELDQKIDRRG